MSRLIDADALKRDVKRWFASTANRERMKEALDSAPTIEAEPVRHAYWQELLGCGYTVCSACDFIPYSINDKFCPNCGAKMDGGKENDRK